MADEPVKKRARTKKSTRPVASAQTGTSAVPAAPSSAEKTSDKSTTASAAESRDQAAPGARPGDLSASTATGPAAPVERAGSAAAASTASSVQQEAKDVAFLRLSSDCRPSMQLSPLIYLNKDVVTVGRLPTNDVAMDSKRTPQMISRQHARLEASNADGVQDWIINDCGSVNGITVNGEAVAKEGRKLRPGDVINFGRRVTPPEFEFIFEARATVSESSTAGAASSAQPDEAFAEQMERIAALEKELKAERDENEKQAAEAIKRRQASKTALNVSELSSELACCICREWLVHAATIECSHSFCWSCIDRWLQTKKFVCPVCREEVTREPVRTRAVDTIVRKTVQRLPDVEKAEYEERVSSAEAAERRNRRLLADLEKSVDDALKKGKHFFHINSNWGKRDKDTFQKGVKEYTGSARETYCRLTGLTVQWVHSADPDKLNQALHNLGMGKQVNLPEDEIRRRLLMFLRYG